jgi:hypothetical protein
MIIAGMDPSLTGTAVVISDPAAGPEGYRIRRFSSKSRGDDVKNRIGRFEAMIGEIDDYLEVHGVTHVFLENYSYGSAYNVTLLAEFGGLLRWHLVTREFVAEVAPSTLKKFVTGRGDTKGKDVMGSHMTKRWGVVFANSDEGDAYCLWRLDRVCLEIDAPENHAQRECMGKVMGFAVAPAPRAPGEKKPRKQKPTPLLPPPPSDDIPF